MYESLTRYLPALKDAEQFGTWVFDRNNDGTMEHPIQMPYVDFGDLASSIEQAIYAFMENHPDFELNRYHDILERNGLSWDSRVMRDADCAMLDGQAIMALLMGAVRAERFCDGALLAFFENGSITRWIERLEEIDRQSRES